MSAQHSCIVCVYKRMLKRGPIPWPVLSLSVPVCERHEEEARKHYSGATFSRGYELYPQGSDA